MDDAHRAELGGLLRERRASVEQTVTSRCVVEFLDTVRDQLL
jgi:hypothetical protein